MNLSQGLKILEDKILEDFMTQKTDLEKSKAKLEKMIQDMTESSAAYMNLTTIMDLVDLSKLYKEEPWGFLLGYEQKPEIFNSNGTQINIPLFYPFLDAPATAIEESSNRSSILLDFALRAILSYPMGHANVYMFDWDAGGCFNVLSPISTKLDDLDTPNNYFHYISTRSQMEQALDSILDIIDYNIHNYAATYPDLHTYNKQNPSMHVPYIFVFIRDIMHCFSNEDKLSQLVDFLYSSNTCKAGVYLFYTYKKSDLKTKNDYRNQAPILKTLLHKSHQLTLPTSTFKESKILPIPPVEKAVCDFAVNYVHTQKPSVQIVSFKPSITKLLSSGKLWQTPVGGNKYHLYIPLGYADANTKKVADFKFDEPSPMGYVGGITGSGKTILIHNLILNSALIYSPKQLRIHLVDMKAVSFVQYKNLPHVASLSVSSNRKVALSVLENLVAATESRKIKFSNLGVTLIDDYNDLAKNKGIDTLPYMMCIIDEFQNLLPKHDHLSSLAEMLIDKIYKESRAFGIFLILCTQSIGDVNTNIKQVGMKFSLLNNENDSIKLLGNDGAVHLQGKGKAILNTSVSGVASKNEIFQVAYIDEKNDLPVYVQQIQDIYLRQNNNVDKLPHIIFDENEKNVDTAENTLFLSAKAVEHSFIYVGKPLFCRREHVKFWFRRTSQSNVLLVGNDRISALRTIGIISLQFVENYGNNSRVVLLDMQNSNIKTHKKLECLTDDSSIAHTTDIENTITDIYNLLEERKNNGSTNEPEVMFALIDFKKVKNFSKAQSSTSFYFDENTPTSLTEMLKAICSEGAENGIHLVLYCFNYINFKYFLDNINDEKEDFEIKIGFRGGNASQALFGMSLGEVASRNGDALIDIPEIMGLSYTQNRGFEDDCGDPFCIYTKNSLDIARSSIWHKLFTTLQNQELTFNTPVE